MTSREFCIKCVNIHAKIAISNANTNFNLVKFPKNAKFNSHLQKENRGSPAISFRLLFCLQSSDLISKKKNRTWFFRRGSEFLIKI